MCGIVGYIGDKEASDVLVQGLKSLEYRGYDSAGLAILNGGEVQLVRSIGKLAALENLIKERPLHGSLGLGHTRWATHGRPTKENAHPHSCCKSKIFVVHNGIIENYDVLKHDLTGKGHIFKSQTDTEVLAHIIEEFYNGDILEAVKRALENVKGSYALGVVSADERDRFIAVRKDSPLVIGVGNKEMMIASDVPALLNHTRNVIFLEDGDMAEIRQQRLQIYDRKGTLVNRPVKEIKWDAKMAQKNGRKHFMLKEIHEQAETIQNTFRGRIDLNKASVKLEEALPRKLAEEIPKICLVGCGTSYHAGLVARFWMEELAKIPCDVEIASEFRYMKASKEPGTLITAISQSGETADTLAALRDCKRKGFPTLSVCNVLGSTVTRDADNTLYTHCGPEIGVASTKAFTGQLTALLLLSLYIAECRNTIPLSQQRLILKELDYLPHMLQVFLDKSGIVEDVAREYYRAKDFLFLGRHLNYPVALEGALKLKEISYIHAEGYPAGEMKHGPIALIEEGLPVVAIATDSSIKEKMISNIQEVKARGGRVIAITNEIDTEVSDKADHVIAVPRTHEFLSPLLTIIPLQMLAYHIAVLRGCDVDQPRNLAKSVTVE